MHSNKILPIIAAIVLAAGTLPARAETEQTISAFSVWEGHGASFVAGEDENIYSATLIGKLYVDTEKGPVEAGILSCPATVHVKPADRTQRASAICAISTKDGGQVFAELNCTGVYLIGCSGKAKLTGGTGRFEGVTGDGSFTIRSDLADNAYGQRMAGAPKEVAAAQIGGILFFRELHYKLP